MCNSTRQWELLPTFFMVSVMPLNVPSSLWGRIGSENPKFHLWVTLLYLPFTWGQVFVFLHVLCDRHFSRIQNSYTDPQFGAHVSSWWTSADPCEKDCQNQCDVPSEPCQNMEVCALIGNDGVINVRGLSRVSSLGSYYFLYKINVTGGYFYNYLNILLCNQISDPGFSLSFHNGFQSLIFSMNFLHVLVLQLIYWSTEECMVVSPCT